MKTRILIAPVLILVVLAGCTAAQGDSEPAAEVSPSTPTAPALAATPSATPMPPTNTSQPATATPEPPTETPAPVETVTEAAEETAVEPTPILPVGAVADWTASSDFYDIEGRVEVVSATEIVIQDFVFLWPQAPGVDIRLGVDDNFSDEVAVSLKDITGKTYEGRTFTVNIPDAAFDGRTFNSIGVFCFDTGDLFEYAVFEPPSS